jgi:hypothetical protein
LHQSLAIIWLKALHAFGAYPQGAIPNIVFYPSKLLFLTDNPDNMAMPFQIKPILYEKVE